MTLKPGFKTSCELSILFLLVVGGAVTSLLLSIVIPAARAKQNYHNLLCTLKRRIEAETETGSPAQLALLTEHRKAELAKKQILLISTETRGRLDEMAKLLERLESNFKIALDTKALRELALDPGKFFPSMLPKILPLLDDVEALLVADEREKAKQRLEEAQLLVNQSKDVATIQQRLSANIAEIIAESKKLGQAPADPYIASLVQKLEAIPPATLSDPSTPLEDRLSYDQTCYAAHLFLITYKKEVLTLTYPHG